MAQPTGMTGVMWVLVPAVGCWIGWLGADAVFWVCCPSSLIARIRLTYMGSIPRKRCGYISWKRSKKKASQFVFGDYHTTTSIYCNDHKITEFGTTDKNSSTAYIILYKWIDAWFLDSNRRVGVWSLPWRWHVLSIPLTTGRGTSAETCGLDDVFPPDDLGSRPEALC